MIKLDNLSFGFEDYQVFENAFLDCSEQTGIVGLMGASGSGKSTLLNLISGFLKPSSGVISIDARDITHVKTQERNIGYVFQDYALFPNLKVRDNIEFGLKVLNMSRSEIERKVLEVCQLLEIDGILNSSVSQISGGQKQRVALARSIVVSPSVLLLDEVFSAIDNNLKPALRKNIREILENLKITSLVVSHSFEDITELCDSVVFIQEKSISAPRRVDEVIRAPISSEVASLISLRNVFHSIHSSQSQYIPDSALSVSKIDSSLKLNKIAEKYIGSVRFEVYKFGQHEVLFPYSDSSCLYLDELKIQLLNA